MFGLQPLKMWNYLSDLRKKREDGEETLQRTFQLPQPVPVTEVRLANLVGEQVIAVRVELHGVDRKTNKRQNRNTLNTFSTTSFFRLIVLEI